MIVHVYALCLNEELILPYFLRHYEPIAQKIVIYDNGSTDRSIDIIKGSKAVLRRFQTRGEHSDRVQTLLKSTCYRGSRGTADWVIVVDMDEFIHHPDLLGVLAQYKKDGITLPLTQGYDMVSQAPPVSTRQIWEELPFGFAHAKYNKPEVFQPQIEINFEPGCHTAKPTGPVKRSPTAEISLLHYRYLGPDYLSRRYALRMSRMSQDSRRIGWGVIEVPPGQTMRDVIDREFKMIHATQPIVRVV